MSDNPVICQDCWEPIEERPLLRWTAGHSLAAGARRGSAVSDYTTTPTEGFYAVEGPDGINRLHLGPMEVVWHNLDGRVSLDIKAGGHNVNVYTSPTGRSVRVFRDGKEMQ